MWQTDMDDISDPNVVQTEEMCIEAVKQNWHALEYVHNQTEAICMEAVRQCGYTLFSVKNQTEAICMEAVKETGIALQFVKNQTEAICIEAVKQYGHTLKYVRNQTEAICMCAVKQYGYALQYVHNQTEAICMEAVKNNGHTLKYVHHQTDAICMEALSTFSVIPYAYFGQIYNYIVYPSPQLVIRLVKLYPSYTGDIMTKYVTCLMKSYKAGSDAIVTHLVQHTADLLYRPNSVNALVSHAKWHTPQTSAKTVFLMM